MKLTTINADTLILFSDIHGNSDGLLSDLTELRNHYPGAAVVFVGDAMDHWFPSEFNGDSDPKGTRLMEDYSAGSAELSEFPDAEASPEFSRALDAAVSGHTYCGVNVGTIRRSLFGACLSLRALLRLQHSTDLFLLGNHEVDLLSGAWFFRSLQKSFMLSLLGIRGLWCLEYRDYKRGSAPITFGTEATELRETLRAGGENARHAIQSRHQLLRWLDTRPLIGRWREWLIVHGGPSQSLSALLRQCSSMDALSDAIEWRVLRNGYSDPLFCETTAPSDTFLSPRLDTNYFFAESPLIDGLVSFFEASALAVGHNPRLGVAHSCNGFDSIFNICLVDRNILKLDVGLKLQPTGLRRYAVLEGRKDGSTRITEATFSARGLQTKLLSGREVS